MPILGRGQPIQPHVLGNSLIVTAGLASATGTAYNFAPALGAEPTAASAVGAGFTTLGTAGIATATGTAYATSKIGLSVTAGLATATGKAYSTSGATGMPGNATGTAFNAKPSLGAYDPTGALATGNLTDPAAAIATTFTAGLASASGTLAVNSAPALGAEPITATATGTALGLVYAETATATGTAYVATVADKVVTAGLASATGTAIAPVYGLPAPAAGTAYNPPVNITVTPNLSNAAGTAYNAIASIGALPSRASATGTAKNPVPPAIPAQAAASAFNAIPLLYRTPQNLGATVVPVLIDGGAVSLAANYGGTLTLANYGGGLTPVTVDAMCTPVTYDGSCSSLANTYGGTVGVTDFADGTLVGWTMQNVGLTLAENNDESINIAITQNGVALSLSGATINMYFKTAAGTADGSALLFSSAGGSPAITITNSSGGLATAAIPHADLEAETYNFYRIDVVFSGLQNTCIYGNITWITL